MQNAQKMQKNREKDLIWNEKILIKFTSRQIFFERVLHNKFKFKIYL